MSEAERRARPVSRSGPPPFWAPKRGEGGGGTGKTRSGGEAAAADFQQRADHFADHEAEEGAAANGEDEFVRGGSGSVSGSSWHGGVGKRFRPDGLAGYACDAGAQDFADGGALPAFFFVAVGAGERGEIVFAFEERRGLGHGVFVEWKWIVEDVALVEGRDDAAAVDAV